MSAQEKVDVVPARRDDLDAIARLESQAFDAPWKREFFESELSAKGRYATVARNADGIVVGYLFAMYFDDEMHINKIAVDGARRRQGIALALMAACFEFAVVNNIRTISLEVRLSNTIAQGFYEKLKFSSLYIRPRYYPDGESAVVMVYRPAGLPVLSCEF